MQAIIFANRTGDELAPLNSHYCPALLPIGNKAVIEYTLEDIVKSGISQIKLIVSSQAKEIEQYLGRGEKWGLEIDYFLSKPQEETGLILKRLSLVDDENYLLVRGDIFRSPSISQFIDFSMDFSDDFVQAKMANQNAGMMLLPAALPYIADIDWPFSPHFDSTSVVTLVLHGRCFMLDNFRSYMDANLSLATNELPSLSPTDRSYLSANPQQDFYVGAKAHTGPLNRQDGWGIIGENSRIEDNVQLKECIVIGSNCLIDKESILENSLILPNTYVGEKLEVRNSILCKNLLINLQISGVIQINDQALIGANESLAKPGDNKTGSITKGLLFIILILSLPLWPFLSLYSSIRNAFIKQAEHSTISDTFIDNLGLTFQAWRWNIPGAIIARLPQLYHVLTGRLDLFGDSPEARYATGKELRRLGVLGPVQLLLDRTAPEEERQLLEIEFDADPRATKYLHLLWRAFEYKHKF
ncbi:nucleotidyltransferase family protein [Shewanella violacea]|uniref:Translation initiation factor eIF2B subunit gamma n=1 Tax=Shewanella violacea (strain JCM 10179 / CIP 106290 / LMG 19151 / DSS12) TaxID=637905 RepID=D4ZIH7_SHEVD|nr:NDP-sugar synthase [Shewanella violacea]BAJ01476.1 nucleotidyl transferase domain protein [Shewanella violacea DSS12]